MLNLARTPTQPFVAFPETRLEAPPVLLTMAGYAGTLAAVRAFGRAGIRVTIADSDVLGPARWSRYAARRLRCPSVLEPTRFVEWLLAFGRREPGHVLYPTSDDIAWVIAEHASELEHEFLMYQPSASVLVHILDKRALYATCAELGLATPETWYPRSVAEVQRLAREIPFPVLIKPRTEVLLHSHAKGSIVSTPSRLPAAYEAFVRSNRYLPELSQRHPELLLPMIQRYHEAAARRIESLSGFIDASGELFAARDATKILQRPRGAGVGVCFEHQPLPPRLAGDVRRLCRTLGYHGVFEVEFLPVEDRKLLIDFNPRFFGQMEFDIARGLPLPLLAYFGATDDGAALERAIARAKQPALYASKAHTDVTSLAILLFEETLSGRMPRVEVVEWIRWLRAHRFSSDAAFDPGDWLPGVADVLNESYRFFRHPRALWRTLARRS